MPLNKETYLYLPVCLSGKSAGGITTKVMDYGRIWSEFDLQSGYYVHFQIITLKKSMNPLIPKAMNQIVPLLFYKDGFGIK